MLSVNVLNLIALIGINPMETRNPITGTMANSVDRDEMPHDAAFH